MSDVKHNPSTILLFSGKRKAGKDFVTDRLFKLVNPQYVALIRISGPIKIHWGQEKGLDVDLLLGSSEYKETYRREMVSWSENVRKTDYGYFCRAALKMYDAYCKPFWIVSDVRRTTDVKWFKDNFGDRVKTIRILCDDDIRVERGWKFTEGIDDEETECGLDEYTTWDYIVNNSGQDDVLRQFIGKLSRLISTESHICV